MAGELATTAVAVRQPSRAIVAADAVQEQQEQRRLIGEYVKSQMLAGTDYGAIPGTAKPTLLKPGAEKLVQLFRCVPRLRLDDKIEDWGSGLFHYRFTCQIITQADETVVAEGVGSASTFESRYRWRQAERRCPACGAGAIIKGKADYGGGWLCFRKKGGCGAKFADDDHAITSQEVGRVQNPDLHDCINTVLKIAKKRAMVDAALSLARCSDIFTQDTEDLADDAPDPAEATPRTRPPETKARPPADADFRAATSALLAAEDNAILKLVWQDVAAARSLFTDAQFQAITAAKDRRKSELGASPPPAAPPTKAPTVSSDVPRIHDLMADLEELLGREAAEKELSLSGCQGREAINKLPPTAAMVVRKHLAEAKRLAEIDAHAATT